MIFRKEIDSYNLHIEEIKKYANEHDLLKGKYFARYYINEGEIYNNVINGDFSSEDYKTKLTKAMNSFIDTDNINLINNQRAIYSNYILSNIGMYDNDAYNID